MSDLPDPPVEGGGPPLPPQPGDPRGKRVSVPGALFSGVFNAGIIALLASLPGFNLPFILPGFAAVMIPMMAGPVASVTSVFMRLGYVTFPVRRLAGMLETAAGAWSCWAIWHFYPFALASLGLPPVADTIARTAFGVLAILNALGLFGNFVRLLRGERAPRRDRARSRAARRLKREQDAFFEDD
jgi:hypothetical protein